MFIIRKGGIRTAKVRKDLRLKFCLTDEEILTLAKWGILIEEHYSKKQTVGSPRY